MRTYMLGVIACAILMANSVESRKDVPLALASSVIWPFAAIIGFEQIAKGLAK